MCHCVDGCHNIIFVPSCLENIEVNKSAFKPYKATKMKKSQSVQEVQDRKLSRLDAWASNFNMEIADIEKFELNIE